jgi:hypothetical protein
MQTRKALIASTLLACLSAPAWASLTLDFEGVANNTLVGDYYKQTKGAVFTGFGFGALDNDRPGGTLEFGNAPSKWTVLYLADKSGSPVETPELTIEILNGFNSLFSMFYTMSSGAENGHVTLLDAEQQVIAQQDIPTIQGSGCPTSGVDTASSFSCWGTFSIDFRNTGMTARYVRIGGSNKSFLFDDLSFGDPAPIGELPEPAGIALGLTALGALALSRRKQFSRR